MDFFRDLYQQLIIDHNQNPRNFHDIPDATHHADGHNPLCGDEIKVFIKMENGLIEDVAFTGSGCAISKASASIKTTTLKGLELEKVKKLFENFHIMATTGETADDELGKISVLAGVHKYPARVKCATLAWHTFQGAIDKKAEIIKTE